MHSCNRLQRRAWLDLSLPTLSAWKRTAGWQRRPPTSPRSWYLTGVTDDEIAQQAIRCGAQDYLLKDQTDAATIAAPSITPWIAMRGKGTRDRCPRMVGVVRRPAERSIPESGPHDPQCEPIALPDAGQDQGELIGRKCHDLFNCEGGPAAGCPLDRSRATSCKEEAEILNRH